MRPVLETIKSDKIIDENFESIKSTLCGNVSFDNMSVRILEGVTQDADIQNLVIHSGTSRPVGWFPLVGDVYVQEISDRYIDIRSTKPQVAYKLLVLFGPQITDATLKVIGGPAYKTTDEVTTETVTEEISYIEQVDIKYKPLAIQSYTLPNPCLSGGPPTVNYGKVVAGTAYYYVTASGQRVLWRIDKSTGVVDYLDLNAALGAGAITTMKAYDGYLYVAGTSSISAKHEVYKIDTTTFTVDTTYTGDSNVNMHGWNDFYVDANYIYGDFNSSNDRVAYLTRITRSGGAVSTLTLRTSIGAGLYSYPGSVVYVPVQASTNAALFVAVETTDTASAIIVRVEVEDAILGTPLFAITDSLSDTSALGIRNMVNISNTIYAPAIYTTAHDTYGGTVTYISGLVKIATTGAYTFTFVPVDIPYYDVEGFLNTMLLDGTYLNIVFPFRNFPYGGGTVIIRYNPEDDSIGQFFVPMCITGLITRDLNNWAFLDSDNTFLLLKNPGTGNYSNFTFATVDFTDYTE